MEDGQYEEYGKLFGLIYIQYDCSAIFAQLKKTMQIKKIEFTSYTNLKHSV